MLRLPRAPRTRSAGRLRLDNAFVERLWRTVKYEDVYLHEYQDADEVLIGLRRYFRFYNQARKHQSLQYQTPAEVYFGARNGSSNQRQRGASVA